MGALIRSNFPTTENFFLQLQERTHGFAAGISEIQGKFSLDTNAELPQIRYAL